MFFLYYLEISIYSSLYLHDLGQIIQDLQFLGSSFTIKPVSLTSDQDY